MFQNTLKNFLHFLHFLNIELTIWLLVSYMFINSGESVGKVTESDRTLFNFLSLSPLFKGLKKRNYLIIKHGESGESGE